MEHKKIQSTESLTFTSFTASLLRLDSMYGRAVVGFAQRDAPSPDQEPESDQKLADTGERGDIRPGASGKYTAETVEQIANTSDGEQDAEEPGDVARPLSETGNDEQVEAEEDETEISVKVLIRRSAWACN